MKSINRIISSIIVFVVAIFIYFLTAAPDLTFTDCGELAATCCKLGIAHPSGYPLFSILGHLWTMIPFPFTKIYSLNLFAGFLTASSVLVFFNTNYILFKYLNNLVQEKRHQSKQKSNANKSQNIITNQITESSIAILSLINALTYAFALTVWGLAGSIEVYPLQAVLMNLIIYFIIDAMISNLELQKKKLILTAFFIGLAFSNHLTTMLLLPPVLFLFFLPPKSNFKTDYNKVNYLFYLLIPLLVGVSIYIYMPLRSASLPDMNWGWVHRSFQKFIYHIQGKQYQIWMFTGIDAMKNNFIKFLGSLPYQLAWIGLGTMFIGFWYAYKLSKQIFWFLIILIVSCLVYTLNYSIHDIYSYFIQAFIGLMLFSGIGIYYIIRQYPKAILLFFAIPLLNVTMNYAENDNSSDFEVPEYTRIMSENLKPNAIIVSSQWDYFCSAFMYKQRVENYRTDVTLIDHELLRRTWYINQLGVWYPYLTNNSKSEIKAFMEQLELFESGEGYDPNQIQQTYVSLINSFIEKNIDKHPVYLTPDVFDREPEIGADYNKVPEGFAYRLEKKTITPSQVSINNINIEKLLKSAKGKTDYLSVGILDLSSINIANIGRYAIINKQPDVAKEAFQMALRVNPKNKIALQGLQYLNK